jgi:putative peptide zinc metalloprotease protein
MSATVDRPAARAATAASDPPRALARAEGLELLGEVSGSGYKDGARLARRADGQMVQLGPLMYGLLEELDGERDVQALAAAMSQRLGRTLGPEHVVKIGEKLAAQGLIAGFEDKAPPKSNPLLSLRWKVLFTDPKVTRAITRPFELLFRPWVLLPALIGFLAVCWFVLIHKGVAAATSEAFEHPELLLLVLGLTIASAAFHEIGHAAACRYGGGKPGGMGAGIYLVWPAFYTDVTDAYRLPRRARLRTDMGGIYFNAFVAVLTLGIWLATGIEALLLLIAIQMLEIVKNLSPVIRADGYHILSDATGVPDLYAHMGPTLKRLLPWKRREPSALKGWARVFVTAWVLIIVPILLAMAFSAILLFPKLAATAWESGSNLLSAMPDQDAFGVATSVARLFALVLPVLGVTLVVQRMVTSMGKKAWRWSDGRHPRQALVVTGAAALVAVTAWAWWPSGQYQPVRPTDRGTLVSAFTAVSAPAATARPTGFAAVAAPPQLAPGRHLAVALIPRGGPTEEHPALYVVNGGDDEDEPTVLVSPDAPDPSKAPSMDDDADGAGTATPPSEEAAAGAPASGAPTTPTGPATQLPFKLPDAPGEGDSQALATNTTDGGIVYDIAYSLVTVSGGADVTNENSAYALASCKACTTLAVSFQLVLVVGQSDKIMPINVAEALNLNCPECITTAIAKQLVISVKSQPSEELLRRLTEELKKLDAIDSSDPPAEVLRQVNAVSDAIDKALDESGITYPKATPTPAAAQPQSQSQTQTPTSTPSPTPGTSATPSATPSAAPTASPTPAATETPAAATPTPSPTAAATETPSPTP